MAESSIPNKDDLKDISNEIPSNTILNNQPLVTDPIIIQTQDDVTEVETPLAIPITGDHLFNNRKTDSLDSFRIDDQDWETIDINNNESKYPILQKIKQFLTKFYNSIILPNIGISLLIISQFLNSIMVTTCKLLVTNKDFNEPIHPLQILFVRMFITYICCLIYMFITKSIEQAPFGPPKLRKLLIIRGIVGFFGVFGMYFSLQYLSLSDAVSITFLVPMSTAFLAFIILKEKYSILEAICSIFSLGGVLLIAKPSFIFGKEIEKENGGDESIESSSSEKRILATVIGLIGVLGASSVYIILRKIGMNAHPLLSVSYFALTCCIITFISILIIPSLSFVLPQNSYQWFLFSIIGFSGFFMQFSLTAGIQRVKAARASLMTYSGMVFAILWDLLIWGHLPGLLSFCGIALIIGNAIIILKFKPEYKDDAKNSEDSKIQDIENNGNYDKLNNDIAMQDFIITDDEEEDEEDSSSSDSGKNTNQKF
ncbi:uncharacterized protein KGF55_000695 [Candida pseudojiufengensis]|uniref:uncharacterized protein n=1 Tax=Candida pseudojiufengensis TaxID=497109 RepID=UPI0022240CBF|nr:uncharacterized protein KGF55_000695 [Candida pseudojiufengensis]KAI5966386.1 hypothetical protein KGF55_000695 [Candida pseudojiufengensis]